MPKIACTVADVSHLPSRNILENYYDEETKVDFSTNNAF